jgi:hypothetical protein
MKKTDKTILEALNFAISKEEFSQKVGLHVIRDDLSYIEAALHICEELGLDPEDIGSLIDAPLRAKLEIEAQNSNLLPKSKSNTATLPL